MFSMHYLSEGNAELRLKLLVFIDEVLFSLMSAEKEERERGSYNLVSSFHYVSLLY